MTSRSRGWLEAVGASARSEAQVGAVLHAYLLLWGGVRLLQAVISIAVWRNVAGASGGSTDGFTAAEFAGYFLIVLVVLELTHTWVRGRLPTQIRTGELSPLLLRPLHPLLESFGRMSAFNLMLTIGLAPSVVVLWFVFGAHVNVSAGSIVAGILILPLATVARFLVDALVGVTAFWLTRTDALQSLYAYGSLVFAGQFAPLALLPGPLQTTARILPFYWTLGFPVELLTGRCTLHEGIVGVAMLVGWTALLFALVSLAWARGVRAYGAVGA
jgi:ABC-2 type transport system permease protein